MQEMTQAYQGYFKNGRFMPLELETVTIPDEIEVYITVTGRKVTQQPETSVITVDEEELKKRREMLKSITGIIKTDVDVKAMRAERIAKRGLLE
jgi:hypothetical protein